MKTDLGPEAKRYRAMTYLEQGKHLFNARRFQEALDLFEKAIKEDDSLLRAYTAKATTLIQLNKPYDAIKLCDDVILKDGTFALAYATRGTALNKLGKDKEAEGAYREALELNPYDAIVNYNFSCFWSLNNNEEECKKYLTIALNIEPDMNTAAAIDMDFSSYKETEWFKELTAFK